MNNPTYIDKQKSLICCLALILAIFTTNASAQQTGEFTYQGNLKDGGVPADGIYDFIFQVWTAPVGGDQVGQNTLGNIPVSSGVFTANLAAVTNAFDGSERWLEIHVRQDGAGSYTTLPRQKIERTPYADLAFALPNVAADNGRIGIGSTSPAAALEIQGGKDWNGNSDAVALSFAFRDGGFRHFIQSRHLDGVTHGNALDFHLNTGNNAEDSLMPGTGNTLALTIDGVGTGIRSQYPVSSLDVRGPTLNHIGQMAIVDSEHSIDFLACKPFISGWGNGIGTGIGGTNTAERVWTLGKDSELTSVILRSDLPSGNLDFGTKTGSHMRIHYNGQVTIGDQLGYKPATLTVSGSAASLSRTGAGWIRAQNGPEWNYTVPAGDRSIMATAAIWGSEFIAFSDARIKNVVGVSNAADDLDTLRKIEVTDYRFKDRIARGNRQQKKLIAQQVEDVYPQAVSRSTGHLPDIYKAADISADGWIKLKSDLKVGDRVKLVDSSDQSGVYEVTQKSETRFRTAFRTEGGQVFVYGREVDDFRAVDYEAISMLNVSATQEIARQLEAKDSEIKSLKQQLAAQRAHTLAMETRLARIESAIASGPAIQDKVASAAK